MAFTILKDKKNYLRNWKILYSIPNILNSTIILWKYFSEVNDRLKTNGKLLKILKPIHKMYFIIYFTLNIGYILKSIHEMEYIKYFNIT